MKKKIVLSLLFTLIIAANVNCIKAHAYSNFNQKTDNQKVKVFSSIFGNSIKNYLKEADAIAKEMQDSLQYQLYIEENWDNLEVQKDMDLYNSNDKSLGKPGDILITVVDTNNSDINAIKVGSLTTHAAFVDSDPKKVLELLQEGVLNCENDWRTRYKKVLVVRPNLDEKIISDAIAYGHTKIGTPFSYFSNLFNKTKTDKFYCSQFVWNCYLNSGVDLDGNGGKAVFPYDFIRSDKVSIVYKQGE